MVDVLVVGAGPFGLSIAAALADRGVNHLIVGEPMGFWRNQMPEDMVLRSGADWHLDPGGEFTIERVLAERGTSVGESSPLTRTLYLDYTDWFQAKRAIAPEPVLIDRLDIDAGGQFVATQVDGECIAARRVVLALGMGFFAHVPTELERLFPVGRGKHTGTCVEFSGLRGKRCLIVGGRQAAFEWAALIREAGAAEVLISHRHASPAFAESDWTWVSPLVDGMVADPGWYRALSPDEQGTVTRRLWNEGRLKVEPWLEPRVQRDGITVIPNSTVVSCTELPSGAMAIGLSTGDTVEVDEVIFATGYKVDLARVPLLTRGNVFSRIERRNGYPVLDRRFESSVPGLFITSMAAGQDFGPFFGFTVSARASAAIIASALA